MFSTSRYSPYRPAYAPPDIPIVVYGTRWCAATQMVRRYLERAGLPYRYVDLEMDPQAAQQLRWWTGGTVSHPTVYLAGEVLVEPTLRELDWAVIRRGLR